MLVFFILDLSAASDPVGHSRLQTASCLVSWDVTLPSCLTGSSSSPWLVLLIPLTTNARLPEVQSWIALPLLRWPPSTYSFNFSCALHSHIYTYSHILSHELQTHISNSLLDLSIRCLSGILNLTILKPNSRSKPFPPSAFPILVSNSSVPLAAQTQVFDSSSLLSFQVHIPLITRSCQLFLQNV